jgi:hypothetical protein
MRAGNVEAEDFLSTLGLWVSGGEQSRRASLDTRLSFIPFFLSFHSGGSGVRPAQ